MNSSPPVVPAIKALACPACGGSIEIRAAGHTVTVICRYCGSVLDVANPDVRLLIRYEEAAAELELPLGTRGALRGVEWEVIGYARRSEGGGYPWEEYLLFNPYEGYRWLVTAGRGWSFGKLLTRTPVWSNFAPSVDGEAYQAFFSNGRAQVDYVLGEFYWRVRVGEEVATDDYVRPGWMLSREANDKEVSWSLSELLDPKEMKGAFGIDAPINPWPPLPHQPSPYLKPLKTGGMIALAAIGLLFAMTVLLGSGQSLLQQNIPIELSGAGRTVTLGPITVTRPYQLVSIQADAPTLSNAWIDLDYSLVNRATQASYDAYGLAERYSGRDGDGPWTEGDRSTTVKLAAVPSGSYDLVINYSASQWTDPAPSYGSAAYSLGGTLSITVRQASVFPSNFLLALLLLLAPLIYLFTRHLSFEKARQYESDAAPSGLAAMFTPAEEEEEDEEE